jgi:hypothetical protein
VILGSIFILVGLYALVTAVVPGWRGASIPRLLPVIGRPPVVDPRGPVSSLAVAFVCGTAGVGFWLAETDPQFNWARLAAPLAIGLILLMVGEWWDGVNFRRAQARSLAERREQLLEEVNAKREEVMRDK